MFSGYSGIGVIFFNRSVFFVALRYIKGSRKQHFASLVAVLATLGIAIGVGALIVVSSIMQGLQDRLKANILNDCAHVVVKAVPQDIAYLLDIPYVNALVPFVQGEAMMQYQSDITMVTLQGTDTNNLYVSTDYAPKLGLTTRTRQSFLEHLSDSMNEDGVLDNALRFCIKMPSVDRSGYEYGSIFSFDEGSYELAVNYQMLMHYGLSTINQDKVRLISTQNARYTPFGMTPVQRNFKVTAAINNLDKSPAPTVIGNYEDVRNFLRIPAYEQYYRLFLSDPFRVEQVVSYLQGRFEFTDWRSRYGDFFKAVGLEKIAMSVMLCLIVLVAAFNILSSLTMLVSSRVSEIAILKTIGFSNRSLLGIFILVGMSSSVVGSIIGLVIGIPFAINAQAILNALGISIVQGELPIEISVANIVTIVAICQAISLLCTFYPAYYASKADPVVNLVNS